MTTDEQTPREAGLSPRERGNLQRRRLAHSEGGSIPARAGEPRARRCWGGWSTVYPRASGGTSGATVLGGLVYGLSPRERGNRPGSPSPCSRSRSIPARAGEPRRCGRPHRLAEVYPRASGGTGYPISHRECAGGLSPRERGNLLLGPELRPILGSIPARAGEPTTSARTVTTRWVYPRASGGTISGGSKPEREVGLSPRERGNRSTSATSERCTGSIPARAGEPCTRCPTPTVAGVYPRASGGTDHPRGVDTAKEGLSPRERGNR